jgi:deoxyadenosine/deoxycytidine kinase
MQSQSGKTDAVTNYMEVSRTLDYYLNKCRKYGFAMSRVMPNHATVFFKCNFPFAKNQIRKIILKTFNRRHLAAWCLYNACFRRIEALMRKICDTPKMYIMILSDTKKREARIEKRCTRHLMQHVDGQV